MSGMKRGGGDVKSISGAGEADFPQSKRRLLKHVPGIPMFRYS